MKMPKGNVKFAYGKFENLPYSAEEIKLYMVSGEPYIYVVPISEIPYSYRKNETKIEDDLPRYLIQIE